MLAGVLTAEYGLGKATDAADADAAGGALPAGNVDGAGVAVDVDAGDAAAGALLDAGAGTVGGSGGGVKMPRRCRASRSFSSLAALAAALSC